MDYAALKARILGDAELAALAGPESDDSAPGVPYPLAKDQTILETMQARTTPVVGSVSVEKVFDALYLSGEYLALKTAQMQGDSDAVFAFAALADAKTLGPGNVSMSSPQTLGLMGQLVARGLISQASVDMLIAAATTQTTETEAIGVTNNIDIAIALGRIGLGSQS